MVRMSLLRSWTFAVALGLVGVGCGSDVRPGTPPKHLLLITVDTLRADHLSSWLYGRPTSLTPSTEDERRRGGDLCLDTLAAEGVMFQSAYSPRGMTCPSIASLMTGLTPLEHGLLDNGEVLGDEFGTLAETFAAAGFDTAGFTSNALLVPPSGLAQGFATFESFDGADRDVEVVGAALKWLRERDLEAGPPIFLWIHLMGPHLPYAPLPMGTSQGKVDFATRFTDPDYTGPANGSREFLDAAYLNGTPLDGYDVNHVVSLYDGEIARTNQLVRTFLQLYSGVFDEEPKHHLDDTLLVFAADHGEELYEHNRYWAHSKSVYSSVLHVPLFFRHPNSLTGRRVIAEKVTLEDVAPTLFDWFGLAPPGPLYGRSLLPLVDTYKDFEFESRSAFGAWRDKIFTVRASKADGSGDWRLEWNPDKLEPMDKPPGSYPIPELGLYDLAADPKEQRNVAAEEPEVVAELEATLRDWLEEQVRAQRSARAPELAGALSGLGYGEFDPEGAGE
jgi:arylsulfatase A-like enzyme